MRSKVHDRLWRANMRVVLLVLGLLAAPAAWAQQTVSGTVTEAATGTPIPGVNVIVKGSSFGTATDVDGRYTVQVPAGGQTLVFSFVGFQKKEVALAAGQTTLDVALEESIMGLGETVITASRQEEKVLDAPASISVLDAREVQQDAAAASSTISVLRNTTGVDMSQTGVDRREVVLRGFNNAFSGATYVLTDYRQAAVPALGVNVHSIMPNLSIDVERVEVVRGPGSALYGAGVDAGVIHFITKDPFSYPGTTVSVYGGERSMMGGQFRQAGTVGQKLGYKITGAYTQADDWGLDPSLEPDQQELADDKTPRNNDFQKINVNGLLQYELSDGVTLTANGGYSALTATVLSGVGTVQADGFGYTYGQLRLQAGDFFSQVYVNRNNAGDSFVYDNDFDGNGQSDPVVDNSVQINAQAQYDLALADGRQRFIFGADFENLEPDTKGTIYGRNEGDDTITEYGAYVQSATAITPKLDLTLAARADYNNVVDKLQLSPRAAIVFKVTPSHSLRATYNRAFSSPGTNSLFLDIPARTSQFPGTPYALVFQGRGSYQGFSFDTFRSSHTVAFSLPFPGVFGQDVPVDGIPLQAVYGVVAGQFAARLADPSAELPAPFAGLNGDQRAALAQALLGLVPAVQGTTPAALGVPREGGGLRFVTGPVDIQPLDQTTSQVIELGYKGVFANRVLLAVDGYYVNKKDFVGPLAFESPLAFALSLEGDLSEALAPVIAGAAQQDPNVAGLLQGLGLTPQQAAALIASIADDELSGIPVGVVQPDQALNSDPNTVAGFLAYRNFGDLSYWGADVSLQVMASDRLNLFSNLSVVSDDYFDNEELGEDNPELGLALNASTFKLKGGAEYAVPAGLSASVAARYVKGFPVQSGPYVGTVDDYFLLDLGAGYDFSRYAPGLRLDVSVTNVLDEMHYEFVGAPQIGRVALARFTYTF